MLTDLTRQARITGPAASPTNVPSYGRRPVLVTGVRLPAPTSVPGALRGAARLIANNGHFQGDYLPDPFDRESSSVHASRPLSIAAAIRCAVTGDPHRPAPLSEVAIASLAQRLEVDGHPPFAEDWGWLEFHVAAWGDVEGRRMETVVAVLEAAADAAEVSA